MRLPFGIGKPKRVAEPQSVPVDDTVPLDGAEPQGACASETGTHPATGNRLVQMARFARFNSGPRSWTVWRTAVVAILIYVVAANLSYFLVLKPVWSRLDVLQSRKTIIEDFFVVRESSSAVAGFRDGLMKGDQRMTIITSLEHIAGEAGVRVSGEPRLLPEVEVSKHMVEYPIELTLAGSYHKVGSFLGRVESSSRFLIVRRIVFEVKDDGRGDTEARIIVGAVSWED
ncbi:type 4a pilus biogenesis protein PilO [bacterium]|nr:type 4a pilus biogenesis protein PilO [bacterium]